MKNTFYMAKKFYQKRNEKNKMLIKINDEKNCMCSYAFDQ